jgi:phosphatidylinositol-3,4,5-trisphosphate 3-phosphatase/dual-specificity protein phosphatase PTEN
MANLLRHKVSKKKRRYIQDGFDLDLSYITERIIAMGFPADKVEGLYRNPIKQVKKFYEQKHSEKYKLYNLCAERTYDAKKFHGRVSHYPFEDHNAPPVDLIVRCCKDIEDWLAADAENIVGINCKAGKGRTGLIICCYLLHSKECKTTDEALTYYGTKRTHDGKGVTIASQQRYIRYYEKILQFGGIPPIRALYLNKLRVHTLPNFPSDPYLTVEMKGHIVFKTAPVKVPSAKSGEAYFDIDCSNTPVFGDVKIQLSCAAGNKTQNLCHFWFNTGFVDETNKVTLYKGEIDVANKDKKCVRFKSEFALEMMFDEIEGEHKGKVPQVVITEEDNPKSPSKKRRRIVSVVLNDNTVDPPKEVLVIDKTKKGKNNNNNSGTEQTPEPETETKPTENGHEDKPTEASNGEKPKEKKDKDGRNRGRSFYHYKEYSDEGKHAKDEDVSSTTSEEFQEYFESFEESNSTELVVQSNTNANARKDSATNLKESGKGTKNSPKPSKRASKDDESAEGKTKSPRTKSKTDVRTTDSPRTKSKTDVRVSDSPRKKDDEGAETKKDKKDKKDKKGEKVEKTDKPVEPVAEKKDEPKTLQVHEGDKTTKRKGSKKELKKDDKKDDKKEDKKDDTKDETNGEGKKDEPSEQAENKDVKKVKGESTPKGSPKPEKKAKEDKKAEKEKKKQDEKDEKEKKKQEEKDGKEKKKQEEKDGKEKKKVEEKEDKKKDDKKGKKKDDVTDKHAAEEKEEEVSSPKSEKKVKENGPESKKPAKEKENGAKDVKEKKEKENGAAEPTKKKEKKDKSNGTAENKEAAVTTD